MFCYSIQNTQQFSTSQHELIYVINVRIYVTLSVRHTPQLNHLRFHTDALTQKIPQVEAVRYLIFEYNVIALRPVLTLFCRYIKLYFNRKQKQ